MMLRFVLATVHGGVMLRARPVDNTHPWTNILHFKDNGIIRRVEGVNPRIGLQLDEQGRIISDG